MSGALKNGKHMKVGLVSFCNDGYPRDTLNNWLDACRQLLANYDLVDAGLVWDMTVAREKSPLLRGCDAIVVPCLSACGSAYSVEFLREYFHLPILLWMAGGEIEPSGRFITGAAGAGFASLRMPLQRMGAQRIMTLVGKPSDPATKKSLERCMRVLNAYCSLRHATILMVGYSDLGFYSGTFDPQSVKKLLGTEIVHIPSLLLPQLMEQAAKTEIDDFVARYADWTDGAGAKPGEIENIARLYSALKQLIQMYHADGISVKCFEGFTLCSGFTPCIPLSVLGSEVCSACKCDINAMLSQLILRYLTGEPAAFMEIYDVNNGNVLMANCGLTPCHHIVGCRHTDRFTWGDVDGIIDASQRRTGRATLLRLDRGTEGSYVMHCVCDEAVTATAWKELGWDDPAPAFPSIELRTDADAFMRNALGQHYAVCYEDVADELRMLAELLKIDYI